MKTHLNPTWKVQGDVGITYVNTFLFLIELSLASIASFHLFQSECLYPEDSIPLRTSEKRGKQQAMQPWRATCSSALDPDS
jgi:hypothetical protein